MQAPKGRDRGERSRSQRRDCDQYPPAAVATMSIVLVLVLLVVAFLLLGGLVRFCESIIGPVVATATTSSTIDAGSTKATSDC